MPDGIQSQVTSDGICILTFDRPGSSANVLDRRTLEEFARALDIVASSATLKGLVILSAKPSVFIAGADLHLFAEGVSAEHMSAYIEFGQRQISRLSALPIPTVATIHGACLGGGYELCLACDWRIASDARLTRIGLPETTLGLLPAWGGTTRLPKLIGLEPALDLILSGKRLTAEQALQAGLVDEVVPLDHMMQAARERIQKCEREREKTGWARLEAQPSPFRARPIRSAPDPETLKSILESRRQAQVQKSRHSNPACLKALEVAVAGLSRPNDTSLSAERDALSELVRLESTQNLLRFYFLKERARKNGKNVAAPPAIRKIAVIGAGTMGVGIAYWASSHQLQVALKDISPEATQRGLDRVSRLYEEGVKRKVLTPEEGRRGLELVTIGTSETDLTGCDLVIEAVVEVLETKREIFRELDRALPDSVLLASNTSALPISDIAAAVQHPQRVVGVHFFNPVHLMQLVELIPGRHTELAAIERARRFVQLHGKLPVLVRDSPGFASNRVLMPYLMEAVRLLAAGVGRDDIDSAMVDFGMAMGPLRVIDEVGIDVTLHITATLEKHFGERVLAPDLLRQMARLGKLGRKTSAGFYAHGAEARHVALLHDTVTARKSLSREDLQQRMLLMMINEAARCVEESVVSDPADVDLIMMTGVGFPPSIGGPLRCADNIGMKRVVTDLEKLEAQEGARFQPCTLLREMAHKQEKFSGSAPVLGRSNV